jgi:hypothetical protein
MSTDELLRRSLPNATIVDEVETKLILNGFTSQKSLQTGKYLFVDRIDLPTVVISGINDKFHRIANAICLFEIGNEMIGHYGQFNISTLISSFSTHNGKKASLLYGRPSNNIDWDELKMNYLQSRVLNKLITVNSSKANIVDWKFADQNDLTILDSKIVLTKPLQNHLGNKNLISILNESVK